MYSQVQVSIRRFAITGLPTYLLALLHSLAFWFVRVENLSQLFYALFETARFPVGVFPRWLRIVFTFVIPVAFITTVPASAAVGTLGWSLGPAAPAIALLGLFVSHVVWQFALKHYTSASS
jgi:ABC-2 type transport system permease protein